MAGNRACVGPCVAGGVHGRVWGMRGRGWGMHSRGHAKQGAYMAGSVCGKGACIAGGMHGRWTCMAGGVHGRWAFLAGEKVTAVHNTHPTGMHSCY